MFVCFIVWWVGWHGGIFSWEEELIAESCDSFTEQTAVLPLIHPCSDVRPTPGEELPEGTVCLCTVVETLVKNVLSLTQPPHTPVKQRCDPSPWPAGLQRASPLVEGRSWLGVAATSPGVWARFSGAHLLQSSGFATAVPVWSWGCRQCLQYGLKAFGVLERKGFQGQQRNEWLFVQI